MTSYLMRQLKELLVGSNPYASATKASPGQLTDRQLIKQESAIGRTLFGPITAGHAREFFCLDEYTWVWYEEWQDEKGVMKSRTIRYEIHPKGILKVEDGGKSYAFLKLDELKNLAAATRIYRDRVRNELYADVLQ